MKAQECNLVRDINNDTALHHLGSQQKTHEHAGSNRTQRGTDHVAVLHRNLLCWSENKQINNNFFMLNSPFLF